MVAVSGRTLVLVVAVVVRTSAMATAMAGDTLALEVVGRTLVLATAMVDGTLAMTTAIGSRTLVLVVEGRTMSTRRRCLLPEPACLPWAWP
jgi:hypothetical protein